MDGPLPREVVAAEAYAAGPQTDAAVVTGLPARYVNDLGYDFAASGAQMELGPNWPKSWPPNAGRCKPWSADCWGASARTAATWCRPCGRVPSAERLRPSHPVSQWFWA